MAFPNNRRVQFNVEVDWKALPVHTNTLEGVSTDVETLRFRRERNSHRGIASLTRLRTLVIFCVNQECLEEISELPSLTTLYISETSASSADCLSRCRSLRHLIIKGGTKFESLKWIESMPPLDSLLLEHFKRLSDITPIESMPSLRSFGFEGSMWATQYVESLSPIARLPNIEAVFLSNLRTRNDGLNPLQEAKSLRYMESAAYYPDEQFLALRRALPNLDCQWFRDIEEYGGTKQAIKERVKKMRLRPNQPRDSTP